MMTLHTATTTGVNQPSVWALELVSVCLLYAIFNNQLFIWFIFFCFFYCISRNSTQFLIIMILSEFLRLPFWFDHFYWFLFSAFPGNFSLILNKMLVREFSLCEKSPRVKVYKNVLILVTEIVNLSIFV